MFSFDDRAYTLNEMLSANTDDDYLCAWLKCAQVGEHFTTGGATGESTVERIL